jgi:hypothetical protein
VINVIVGEIIAGYAAVVATASVLFQIRQARIGRRPQIELELIHTQRKQLPGEDRPYLIVFLEVRNRGNHPVRIVGAHINSPKIRYDFRPQAIEITRSGITLTIPDETAINRDDKVDMLPLPGIILPGDGASRDISNRMIPAEDIAKIAKTLKDKDKSGSEVDDFFADVNNSFREELYGWVEVSTGEPFHTKRVKYEWDAVWK